MSSQAQAPLPIRTQLPAGFGNLDAVIGVVGSNGTDILQPDSSGRLTVKLNDGTGNSISSTANNLHVNINAQGVAGLKISRDGNAPTAANGSFVELTTANAILAVGNPVPTRLSNGTAFNALSAPAFVQLSDGTIAFGTPSNPIIVSDTGLAAGGTPQRDYEQTTGASIAAAGTHNFDFAVPLGETLRLLKVTVGGHGNIHFDVIDDAAGDENGPDPIVTLYVSTANPYATYEFVIPYEAIGGAAGTTFRILATNDGNKAVDATVSFEATLD